MDSPAPALPHTNALLAYLDGQQAERTAAWPEVLATTVVSLAAQFAHFDWTGIYLVQDAVLHLGPFVGPATEHVTIPVGAGICGAAAAERQTIVVDDVAADPRYLACFTTTRSEIVVPILDGARVIGEIDIDSDRAAAFTAEDRAFLERVAEGLSRLAPPPSDGASVAPLQLARAEHAAAASAGVRPATHQGV